MGRGVALAVAWALVGLAARLDGFKIVNDVKKVMYIEQKYQGGFYKLLNINGATGSQAPPTKRNINGRPEPYFVEGMMLHAQYLGSQLTEERVIVVNATMFEPLMKRLLTDSATAKYVLAVLVDTSTGTLPASQSATSTFPNSWNAPYADKSYQWNPWGTALERQAFNFPVLQMTPAVSLEVAKRALYNSEADYSSAREWAEVEFTMEAEGTSEDCLLRPPNNPAFPNEKQGPSCQLVGGFSVWSAMPPLPNGPQLWSGNGPLRRFDGPQPGNGKPITLVVAQVDTSGVFHDSVSGAGSPMSGLVAMLTAMDLLRQNNMTEQYARQLAFVAMAGEPWDYMGSRRMIKELDTNTTAVRGLEIDLIDQVLELGMVGRSFNRSANRTTLYKHAQRGGGYGDAGALRGAVDAAVGATTEWNVVASDASATTPGIPPSSLMSFLRRKQAIQGLVLTEFDTQYTNPYVYSSYDGPDFVDLEALASSAAVLARTLHALGSQGVTPPLPPLTIDPAYVNRTALALAQCLMIPDLGSRCRLTQAMMVPDRRAYSGDAFPAYSHYIGVLRGVTAEATNTTLKGNLFRFLYNFMANASAIGPPRGYCDPRFNYCPAGEACVFWRSGTKPERDNATMGRCRNATVAFIPAYSTRAVYNDTPNANDNNAGLRLRIWDDNAAYNAEWGWPADPLWTESNWPINTPFLRAYLRESRAAKVGTLVAGVLLTVATGVVSWYARKLFERHLSRPRTT